MQGGDFYQVYRLMGRGFAAVRDQDRNPIHHGIDPSAADADDLPSLVAQCAEAGWTSQPIDPLIQTWASIGTGGHRQRRY